MHKIFLFFLTLLILPDLHAQELNVKVTVNYQNVQTNETRVFTDMQKSFEQFLNNRKWTNDVFATEERINGNLVININEMPSIGTFQATVQIQSSRPVYNTSYQSLMLNFADRDWQFNYVESQPLAFNQNSFTDNITSILAFYANIIIGLDYDTFSEMGGTPYFEKAQQIVNNAQQQGPGWDQFGSNRRRNRYWLAENLLNPQMAPIRRSLYTYHRKGLDTFMQSEDDSRKNMLSALNEMQKIAKVFPQAILIISFFDAKNDELISVFSKGAPQLRKDAYNTLVAINPAQTDAYAVILKEN